MRWFPFATLLVLVGPGCGSSDNPPDAPTEFDAPPVDASGRDAPPPFDAGIEDTFSALDAPTPATDAATECTPGAVCRAAVNTCDREETCDAAGTCPADEFEPATTDCLAASCSDGVAQPASRCTGTAAECESQPAIACNGFACSGTTCGTTCSTNADCLGTHYCQAGGLCAPRRVDGAACTGAGAGIECISGTCTGSYVDSDGDGRGVGAIDFFSGAGAPTGRALVAGDCCDTDARVFPGQTTGASTPSMCGGFDFDCNGVATPTNTTSNVCVSVGACASGDRDCGGSSTDTGWAGSTPACGASASFVTSCGTMAACSPSTCPGCLVCRATTATRAQSCL